MLQRISISNSAKYDNTNSLLGYRRISSRVIVEQIDRVNPHHMRSVHIPLSHQILVEFDRLILLQFLLRQSHQRNHMDYLTVSLSVLRLESFCYNFIASLPNSMLQEY